MLLKLFQKIILKVTEKNGDLMKLPTKIFNRIKSRLEAQERRFRLDQETW